MKPQVLVVGVQNHITTLEKIWKFLIKLTIYLLMALQFYLHKRNGKSVHTTETFARMSIAVLVTAPNWKQSHCTHII